MKFKKLRSLCTYTRLTILMCITLTLSHYLKTMKRIVTNSLANFTIKKVIVTQPRTSLSNIRRFDILIYKKCRSSLVESPIFETWKSAMMQWTSSTRKGEPRENKFNYTPVSVISLVANEISFPYMTSSNVRSLFLFICSIFRFHLFFEH